MQHFMSQIQPKIPHPPKLQCRQDEFAQPPKVTPPSSEPSSLQVWYSSSSWPVVESCWDALNCVTVCQFSHMTQQWVAASCHSMIMMCRGSLPDLPPHLSHRYLPVPGTSLWSSPSLRSCSCQQCPQGPSPLIALSPITASIPIFHQQRYGLLSLLCILPLSSSLLLCFL